MNDPRINFTSRDWLLVKQWAEKRLATHRTTIENLAQDDRATQQLRGRIAELKLLMALATTPETTANANTLAQE